MNMDFLCTSKIVRNIFQSKKNRSKKAKKDLEIINEVHQCCDEAVNSMELALLFQRISLNIRTKDDLPRFLGYELAAFPPALFDANGMRKTVNVQFYINFDFIDNISPQVDDHFIIDGCFLLQHIFWPAKTPVKHVINSFITYIVEHYSKKCCVIFDGYPESVGGWYIKTAERQNKNIGREIKIDENGIIDEASDTFFNNTRNEVRLINILCEKLNDLGFSSKIAEEDADELIVETAMQFANKKYKTWIVGTDVELLVILSARTQHLDNIFFLHQEKDYNYHVYSNKSFKYPELQCIVLFLHAFTGCNTTSSFLNKGKLAFINLFLKRKDLILEAKKFYDPTTPMFEIAYAGVKIVQKFYDRKNRDITLNELRYRRFVKLSKKGFLVRLESLPPTEGSVVQHAYRTYLQVQLWLGNKKRAIDWGWHIKNRNLIPLHSAISPFPSEFETC